MAKIYVQIEYPDTLRISIGFIQKALNAFIKDTDYSSKDECVKVKEIKRRDII